jgi:hypothetical protein
VADTPLSEAAAGLHEWFKTMVEQGFTEYQACVIIGVMMAHNKETGRE